MPDSGDQGPRDALPVISSSTVAANSRASSESFVGRLWLSDMLYMQGRLANLCGTVYSSGMLHHARRAASQGQVTPAINTTGIRYASLQYDGRSQIA